MKTILYFLGLVLKYFSFFFLLPIIYSSFVHEPISPFLVPLLIALGAGIIIQKLMKMLNLISDRPLALENLTFTQGLILTALSFLVLSAISSIPFLFVLKGKDMIINSLFESTSGITTTGLSIIQNLERIPSSILLWRSEIQWIGGIGIIIVFFFIIFKMRHSKELKHSDGVSASSALYTTLLREKMEKGMKVTASNVFLLYTAYTVVGVILLVLAGMSLFDATNMTFTSISTGGFTVTDDFNHGPLVLGVLSILMLIGAISFVIHTRLLRLRFKEFFSNPEIKLFIILFSISFLLATTVYRNSGTIFFELLSAFTTTGYSTTTISILPHLIIFLMAIGMLIGGTMGSTSGGIKLFRFYTIIKAIPWMINKLSNPQTAIIPFKVDKKPMDATLLLVTEIFISGYMIFIVFGTILFMVLGFSFLDSSFQVLSALSTCGLSTMQLFSIPVIGKIFLMIAMFLGRLEIFPLLVMFRKLVR